MGYLKTAKDDLIADLVNITNAAYPGDPAGTNANQAYFLGNVHPYIKDAAIVLQPDRQYFVHADYAGLGNPFFENVEDAYDQVSTDGSSSSDIAGIIIRGNAPFSEALTLDDNGYVVFIGDSSYSSIINGQINISNGVHIFCNIKVLEDIVITGGSSEFTNCIQKTGTTQQQGNSTLIVNKCIQWGVTTLTGNDNTLWMEHVDNIEKDGSNKSVILTAGMTGGEYVFKNGEALGSLDDADNLITWIKNWDWSVPVTRPTL